MSLDGHLRALENTVLFGANAMHSTGFEEQSATSEVSATYLEQSATYLEQSVTWDGAD